MSIPFRSSISWSLQSLNIWNSCCLRTLIVFIGFLRSVNFLGLDSVRSGLLVYFMSLIRSWFPFIISRMSCVLYRLSKTFEAATSPSTILFSMTLASEISKLSKSLMLILSYVPVIFMVWISWMFRLSFMSIWICWWALISFSSWGLIFSDNTSGFVGDSFWYGFLYFECI